MTIYRLLLIHIIANVTAIVAVAAIVTVAALFFFISSVKRAPGASICLHHPLPVYFVGMRICLYLCLYLYLVYVTQGTFPEVFRIACWAHFRSTLQRKHVYHRFL